MALEPQNASEPHCDICSGTFCHQHGTRPAPGVCVSVGGKEGDSLEQDIRGLGICACHPLTSCRTRQTRPGALRGWTQRPLLPRWAQPCGATFPAASILGGAEGEFRSAEEPGVGVGAFRLGFWSYPICSSAWPHSQDPGDCKGGKGNRGGAFLESGPVPGARSAV